MTPELKAFKHYKKNIDYYLKRMEEFWGDDDKQLQMHQEIADTFAANVEIFRKIITISYERSIERAFR